MSTNELNFSYIKPLANAAHLTEFSDLDMAINSTVVFSSDKTILRAIEKKSSELNLFSIHFTLIQERIDDFLDSYIKQFIYLIGTAIIILLFAMLGMVSALLSLISKNMKDYTIHILCGGRIKNVGLRLMMHVGLIFIIPLISCAFLVGFNLAFIYTIILSLAICIAVLLLPMYKLYFTSVSQMIRRSE
jgi:hypothetical protein